MSSEHAEAGADVVRSSGLTLFRLNAFRVLRLTVATPTKEAVWRADKILARRRAGVDVPDPEVIGWIPQPDEIDLREAAQRIEEPLRRLRDQLLWFDFDGDPRGAALEKALVDADTAALSAYLEASDQDLTGAEPEPDAEETDYEAAARKRQMPLIAHRVNQANARLLLAFSWLHGTGPEPPAGGASGPRKPPRLVFKEGSVIAFAKRVHTLFPAAAPEGRDAAWSPLLREALARWGDLLKNPWLSSYVEQSIDALGDDLVSGDDVDPLMNAVGTALADAVVGEMKLLMLSGSIDRVLELVRVAADSGIDPTHWTVAFRPIRALFRAELDELDALIAPDKPANVKEIDLYLQRVRALSARWESLDTAEAFGLDQMIDAAVSKAIDRVRQVEDAASVLDRIQHVLEEAARVAKSDSTAERARELLRAVESHRESLCHFCQRRDAKAASSGVLAGKKEISREAIFNGVRITYATRVAFVPRCETCAHLHHYIRQARNLAIGLAAACVVLGWVLFESNFGMVVTMALISATGMGVGFLVLSRMVTPKGERQHSAYEGSDGHRFLVGEGFGIESYDYKLDAGERMMRERGIA